MNISRPGQSSQVKSSYKSEIARTLEPWISGTHPPTTASSGVVVTSTTNVPSFTSQLPKDYTHPSINLTSVDPTFSEPTYSQYYPMSRSTVTPGGSGSGHKTPVQSAGGYAAPSGILQQHSQQQQQPPSSTPSGRKTPTSKLKTTSEGLEEQFAAHCRAFSTHFNVSIYSLSLFLLLILTLRKIETSLLQNEFLHQNTHVYNIKLRQLVEGDVNTYLPTISFHFSLCSLLTQAYPYFLSRRACVHTKMGSIKSKVHNDE